MGDFDPKQAFSDPAYWYPNGLLTENGKFSLISEKNGSIMRYVWHACLLPTTVADYAQALSIPEQDLPGEVDTEVTEIVGVFAGMKSSSSVFRDKTWPSMVDVVGTVYNYSIRAGGKDAGSYYYNMLDWVRQYARELEKDNPDQDTLSDLKDSIVGACKSQMTDIGTLQTSATDIQTKFSDFKTACATYENSLDSIITVIQNKLGTLDGKTGKIATTMADIKQKAKLLETETKEYDRDVVIAATTPSYEWLGLIGFAAAVTVAVIYGDRARRLEKAISELKKAIEQEQTDLQAMVSLETHFTAVKRYTSGLRDELDGAITDLGKHIGLWETIKTKLTGLKGFVLKLEDNIEPVLLEKVDLENIVEQWNNLATAANSYELDAFQNETPQPMSVDTYLEKLRQKF
ncbi:hypothetical protein BDV12DRAFT_180687 [Aspergillus spectabilis]